MSVRWTLFLLGLGVAVGLSWLWPRIQQPPTTHAIARELLATGRPDDLVLVVLVAAAILLNTGVTALRFTRVSAAGHLVIA